MSRGVLWGSVVRGWESQPQGEGPHGSTQLSKETRAGHCRAGITRANLTERNSNWALERVTVKVRAEASATEEPDAGKLHVRGSAGGAR